MFWWVYNFKMTWGFQTRMTWGFQAEQSCGPKSVLQKKIGKWHLRRLQHQLTFQKCKYFALYTIIYSFGKFVSYHLTEEQMQTKYPKFVNGNRWIKIVRISKDCNNRLWDWNASFWFSYQTHNKCTKKHWSLLQKCQTKFGGMVMMIIFFNHKSTMYQHAVSPKIIMNGGHIVSVFKIVQ